MVYNWQTGEETQEGYCLYAHINQINYKVYIGISKDVKQRWASKGKTIKVALKYLMPSKNMVGIISRTLFYLME